MKALTAAVSAFVLVAVSGCRVGPEVMRVVDGRLVGGAFVEPEGYASFLGGAIAEARGDLRQALVSYEEAARRDSGDPEIWTRIGDVRCRIDPRGKEGKEALNRAISLDSEYAPAWAARARCGLGDKADKGGEETLEASRRAAIADPMAIEPQVLIARADGARVKGGSTLEASARDRLIALTLVHRESTAAWDALASWARTHGDAGLAAHALSESVRVLPARKTDAAQKAIELAGDGELSAARNLAAAALDAPGPQVPPAAARLAIDEALAAGDMERARLRATRAHMSLDEVAGRALLMRDATLARALAEPLADADAHATGARLVLAVTAQRDCDAKALTRAFEGAARGSAPVPMSALLPFAAAVANAASVEDARLLVDALPHEPLVLGDALMAHAAVDLAARGVLRDELLPKDARIELAARRGETPAPVDSTIDARHRLLALVLQNPNDPQTRALAQHLSPAAAHDPLIAVALARLALSGGTNTDLTAAFKLVALVPADPLAAAAAFDLATRQGDAGAIVPARARLTALARTPAEHALVAE